MREWTEQEEQEMIERAKTGDAQANYELSQWALHRGEEEPDEPRWNRLAAKCLVKAAQAGYGPAREQMEGLLHPEKSQSQSATRRTPEPPEPVRLSDARQAAARQAAQRSRQSGPSRPQSAGQSTARRPAPRQTSRSRYEDEDEYDDGYGYDEEDEEDWDEGYDDRSDRRREPRKSGRRWGERQWRTLEIVCVAICAVLLVLIAVMIITGRKSTAEPTGSAMPPAGDAITTQSTATPEPEQYPDDAVRAAIDAAGLEITPLEEDYETAPTVATVSVSNVTLRLRKGPSTTYTQVAEMPNGTEVPLYARKAGWGLVCYDSEDGPVYGWCSTDYLIITAGSADTGSSVG